VIRRLCIVVTLFIGLTGALIEVSAAPAGAITEGSWPGSSGPVYANKTYGYPYPDAPACTDGGACVLDKWDFDQGQCTSWVAYRLNELNGVAFNDSYDGERWGDATDWATAAEGAGLAVNSTPALGSVAWYSGTAGDDDGHVAYVEQVVSSNEVIVSEMNYDFDNGFRVRTITTSSGWPTDFIHVKDVTAPSRMTSLLLSEPKLQSDGLYLETATVNGSGFGVEPANGEEAPYPPGYDYPNSELWFADVTQNWQFGNSVDGDGNPNAIGVTIKSYSSREVVYTFLDGGSYPWQPPAKGNKIMVAVAGLVCHAKVAFGKGLALTSCTRAGST
jgi:surface antigen